MASGSPSFPVIRQAAAAAAAGCRNRPSRCASARAAAKLSASATAHPRPPVRRMIATTSLPARGNGWVMPVAREVERPQWRTNPIGTGPFMFEAWDRGQEIRLTKFDDYWEEGLPYLDGVVIKFIPDIDVRIAQYRQGDLDMILNVPAARVPEMRPVSSIPILESDKILTTGIYFVLLNNRIAPFDNELVRQAFSYAVDRDQFIRGVAGGFSSARATLIADDSPHSISGVENDYYPQNIAKARELLAQAGYPDGIEVRADVASHRCRSGRPVRRSSRPRPRKPGSTSRSRARRWRRC